MSELLELPRYEVLGVPFHPVSREMSQTWLLSAVNSEGFSLVVTLGTEMVMNAQENEQFRGIVHSAKLVVPDGIGLVLAARIAGLEAPERVTGVELLAELLSAAPKARYFFYGASPGVAGKAVQNLMAKFGTFECVGVLDGFVQDDEEVLASIERAEPTVLFVALGSPRQELFLHHHRDRLEAAGVRIGIGVGGSFDVYAGTVQRAPTWVQKIHFEWLYRLLKQPSRWRRMLALPRFAVKILSSPKRSVKVLS